MHEHQDAQALHSAIHLRRDGPNSACIVLAVNSTVKLHHELSFGTDGAQIELAAAGDHVVEHGVKRELVFTRPLRAPAL